MANFAASESESESEALSRHGTGGLPAFLFAVVRCARTSRLYPQSDQMFAAAIQQNFPLAPSDTA